MDRRKLLSLAVAAAANGGVLRNAFAQTSAPGQPLRIIVPTPPGGGSDSAARLLSQSLARLLGEPVLVENKPGAAGSLAAQALIGAQPDGRTLLWTLASMSGLASVMKSSPYRSLSELTPVSVVGHLVYGMFVHPGVPATTVREFVVLARGRAEPLAYATGSLGDYMVSTRFLRETGVQATRVPYRGGAQLLPDLLAGRVHFNLGPLSTGIEHARDGKLKLLAVIQPRRSAQLPDIPTIAEAGYPDIALPSWQALFAPPKTPASAVTAMERAVRSALEDPDLRARYEALGIRPDGADATQLASLARAGEQSWATFVRDYDIPQE